MEIALALVAAALFALGSVLQQKAGMDEPEPDGAGSAGLLLRMARRPVWLVGIAADALGFVFQVLALAIGRLAVVQPVLVSSVVFALPMGARLTGQRVTRLDLGAAVLVTAGLVAFLVVADPTGGREDAPLREWLITGAVLAAVVVPLVLVSRRLRPAPKAATLGIATGILFSLSAALTIPVTDRLDEGLLEPLADWHLYALIAVGYASMTLNQMALSTGALAPAVATSMALDPITSVVLGTTLLQETLHETSFGMVATMSALGAAIAGLVVLSRTTPLADGPPPAAAPAQAA